MQHENILSFEEIREIVEAAVELGIKKVRVTGGEPLVRLGCTELCKSIAEIPGIEEVAITTNGVLLEREAQALKDAGVRRVNVSLDTLNPEKFSQITRGGSFRQVWRGIQKAAQVGLAPIKVNTVLIGGFNDNEIESFVELTRTHPIELRFIELMPMGASREFGENAYLSGDVVLERVPELLPLEDHSGVARLYRLPDGKGKVGIISPISRHFCETCNRLRLTSEGALKPCLHSNQEFPLRGLHGEALKQAILSAVHAKPQMHGQLDASHMSDAGRTMNSIGG